MASPGGLPRLMNLAKTGSTVPEISSTMRGSPSHDHPDLQGPFHDSPELVRGPPGAHCHVRIAPPTHAQHTSSGRSDDRCSDDPHAPAMLTKCCT